MATATLAEIDDALKSGNLRQALNLAEAARRKSPRDVNLLNIHGNLLTRAGRAQDAVAVFELALQLVPGHPVLRFNLATAHMAGHDYVRAEPHLRKLLIAEPTHLQAAVNLAVTLDRLDRPAEAAAFLECAAALAPKQADIRHNLGHVRYRMGDFQGARQAWQQAVELNPTHARAQCNLGVVLQRMGQLSLAEDALKKAVALDPSLTAAWAALADLHAPGTDGAVAHRRRILAMRPNHAEAQSSLLMCMQYADDVTRAELVDEHRAFGQVHGRGTPRPTARSRKGRPLRVGFVSADFRSHAMRWFALPLFRHRPAKDVVLALYHTSPQSDATTPDFEAAADMWRVVHKLDTRTFTQLVNDDQIDVLIDMSGHAPDNRLRTFVQRPCPLQLAWGDYVDTRGIGELDAILFDRHHIPTAEDDLFVEQVARLPDDYFCWEPPDYAPQVGSGPTSRGQAPVFGCFSEPTKVQPASLALWAKVLQAVPESRFFFNGRGFSGQSERWIQALSAYGIDRARIRVGSGGPHAQFLSQYTDVDVILDTIPYSGGLTTCEALWMGVPVLTFPGDRVAGRHSTAHLRTVGVPELVAVGADDLVHRAVQLVSHPSRLTTYRKQLRSRVRTSPLFDHRGYARNFFGLVGDLWDRLVEPEAR